MFKFKVPRSEVEQATYAKSNGVPEFLITANQTKSIYYLYKVSGGEIEKLGKGKSPLELEAKFKIFEYLRGKR